MTHPFLSDLLCEPKIFWGADKEEDEEEDAEQDEKTKELEEWDSGAAGKRESLLRRIACRESLSRNQKVGYRFDKRDTLREENKYMEAVLEEDCRGARIEERMVMKAYRVAHIEERYSKTACRGAHLVNAYWGRHVG